MREPLSIVQSRELMSVHRRRLESFGLEIEVTHDLSEHTRIVALDHALLAAGLHNRDPMVLNPALEPRWHPHASPANSFIILCRDHHGIDRATIGARILRVGASLPDDIESGQLFYGLDTPECQFRYRSRLRLAELSNSKVALCGGMWLHPENPGKNPEKGEPNLLIAPLWRLLMSAMLAIRWDWCIGIQKVWNLSRHGWEPQGFEIAVRKIFWADEPDPLVLCVMEADDAMGTALTANDYAPRLEACA